MNKRNLFICADCGCPPEDCHKVIAGETDKCPNCRLEKCCCVYPDLPADK